MSVASFGSSALVPRAQAAPKAQDPPKAKLVRIGVSKFGALLNYLRTRKSLEPKLAKLGVQVEWKEFVAGPQLMEALAVDTVDVTTARGCSRTRATTYPPVRSRMPTRPPSPLLSEIATVNEFAGKNPRVIAETLSPKYGLPVEVLEAVERRRSMGSSPSTGG